MSELKQKVISGIFWQGLENFGTYGIMFFVTILLARLVSPSQYGMIALLTVFIALSKVIIDSGFGAALIQCRELTESAKVSVFWLSILLAAVVYAGLWFCAPLIAAFYRMPDLSLMLRVLALILLCNGLTVVHKALILRKMDFRLHSVIAVTSVIVSGAIGIGLAWHGAGAWALVFQQLSLSVVMLVLLWGYFRWIPGFRIHWEELKRLFRFGSKIMYSGILETVFSNLYPLIIGKLFDARMLGFYDRGTFYPQMTTSGLNGIITSVMFPTMSKLQDDLVTLKNVARRMIKVQALLLFPFCLGLAAVSESFILCVLTEKWLPAAPFLQISCVMYMLWPFHTANLQILKALGRSDLMLYLEIAKKGLLLVGIFCTYKLGIMAMMYALVVISVLSMLLNAYPNARLIRYRLREQIADVLPLLGITLAMFAAISLLRLIWAPSWSLLLGQIFVGMVVYTGLCAATGNETFYYILNSMRSFRKKS